MPFPDPIPSILPFGTVTLFAGAPGVGKTTLLADWCRRWRDGEPIMGHPTNRPTAFAYLCGDRQWSSYAPMFLAANFPDIPHYALVEDTTISLADLRKPFKAHELFERCLDKLNIPLGAHVFVDPVSPLFITGDPNRTRDVASSMVGFARRCVERQINLTMSAHFAKQKADPKQRYLRPQDRIAGSTAFAGFSDTQIYMVDPEPPHRPYTVLGWTPRHGQPEEFKLIRDEAGLFVSYNGDTGSSLETATNHANILRCFPPPPEQVSLEALTMTAKITHNLSRATVKRALQRLIQEGQVLRMGRGHYRVIKPA